MHRRWLFTKNRMLGIGLIILGALSTLIDGDATFFLFTLIFGGIAIFVNDEEDCDDWE